MLGAIIGDIVGSRYEHKNHKNKDFTLFNEECCMTDDGIMTLVVAKSIRMCNSDYDKLSAIAIKNMRMIGRKYSDCGFGGMFEKWLYSENPKPYDSYGNGAAMRVSPCAWVAKSEDEAKLLSRKVTEITHNHPEGLKGAEAVTIAIYMARQGSTICEIRNKIESDYYQLNFTIDELRPIYSFDVTCQGTVPQAITAFLESISFEDAIRNAVSIGGDSDTVAAITGSIAEAYYGIDEHIKEQALSFLDDGMRGEYKRWSDFILILSSQNKCIKTINALNNDTNQIDALMEEIKQKESLLTSKRKELEFRTTECKQMELRISELQKESESISDEYIESLNYKLLDLEQKVEVQIRKKDELLELIKTNHSALDKITELKNIKENELKQKKEDYDYALSQVSILEEENRKTPIKLIKNLKSQIKKMELNIATKENEKAHLINIIAGYQKVFDELNIAVIELDDKKNEIVENITEIIYLHTEKIKEIFEEKEQEEEKIKRKIADFKRKFKEINESLPKAQEEYSNFEIRIGLHSDFAKIINSKGYNYEAFRDDIIKKTKEIEELLSIFDEIVSNNVNELDQKAEEIAKRNKTK